MQQEQSQHHNGSTNDHTSNVRGPVASQRILMPQEAACMLASSLAQKHIALGNARFLHTDTHDQLEAVVYHTALQMSGTEHYAYLPHHVAPRLDITLFAVLACRRIFKHLGSCCLLTKKHCYWFSAAAENSLRRVLAPSATFCEELGRAWYFPLMRKQNSE
jgi:hypothetical protein